MSSKHSREQQDKLAPPVSIPVDIANKKLPPLPIYKRKLPNLPQSRSGYVHNACSDNTQQKGHKLATSITITPPVIPTKDINNYDTKRTSRTIRNIFNKMQTKIMENNNRISEIIRINENTFKYRKPKDNDIKPKEINNNNIKSKWRPTLKLICNDDELLNELIVFMTKQYNEENILFIQSVYKLKENIDNLLKVGVENEINIVKKEKIDVEIMSIYNNYITHNAQKQINLSYDCFNNIMNIHLKFKQLCLNEKAMLFDTCCVEIENLIQNSILSGFHQSQEFQSIAHSRNIFSNTINVINDEKQQEEEAETDYDSDDVEYENKDDNQYKDVCFDIYSSNKWTEHNKYILSSQGFAPNSGYHEWKIKILKCSSDRQEFGIISNFDTNIEMNEYGICDTPIFGARAVYGYNKLIKLNKNKKRRGTEHNFYYASYNKDGTARCNKPLSSLNIHQRQWMTGDIIKICLNLTKSSIKFFLNDVPVRKTVSVEKNTTYYPIILYSGNFQYQLIS